MNKTLLCSATISLALGIANISFAQSTTVSPAKMKCSEFVVLEDVYKPSVIYWATGVDKLGIRETDEITVDATHPVAEEVTEECKKTPNAKVTDKINSMAKQGKLSIVKKK